MERLTYYNERKGHYDWRCTNHEVADRLAEYEDAEERGELVRVVRCDGCVYHVDNGYHYCKKLRIDCPLSDFYCAYGKAALKEG